MTAKKERQRLRKWLIPTTQACVPCYTSMGYEAKERELWFHHEVCEVCGKMGDLSSRRDWKLRGG